ncbi:phosphoribosylglycinamide synthetase [Helicosporidium sp. ATCC 50920]|nr:phosphoribosylglycinamide synthetase [Helicosporidium sp. ATCC 50920]|eukprot:KDD75389.1 phosphoribosylglycinamide synthetase [Helicosporidium sp. ATCC 50920]
MRAALLSSASPSARSVSAIPSVGSVSAGRGCALTPGRRACRRPSALARSARRNVLVLGSGGREHALAWRLAQGPSTAQVFVAPGNAGTALDASLRTISDLRPSDHGALVSFCRRNDVDLVVVGPEAYLVEGAVDALSAAGIAAFGPTRAAAELEGSKAFMKDLCAGAGIKTAGYGVFEDAGEAKAFIRRVGAPIVVKTSGLAAGKGVVVAQTEAEAFEAVDEMLSGSKFGAAGAKIVVEEFLRGEEASFFALVDGERCVPLAGAQDHKAVGEGDTGPNTGGMGSYSPAPVLTPELGERAMREVVYPTARAMAAAGRPFRGVLFAGLMIDQGEITLLEHNVRFGDPECQSLMLRLRSDLGDALAAMLRGEDVSDGGRVLGISAMGDTVREAQKNAYAAVDAISYPDGFCRRDIGWRAVAREEGRGSL